MFARIALFVALFAPTVSAQPLERAGGPDDVATMRAVFENFANQARRSQAWRLRHDGSSLTVDLVPIPRPEVWQLAGVDRRDKLEPGVDAYSVRVRWSTLEPNRGRYDWTFTDAEATRCRKAGVGFVFRLMAGTSSPRWSVDGYLADDRTKVDGRIPDPRTTKHRKAIEATLRAIVERYGDQLRAVHVPAFGNSAETNRPRNWTDTAIGDVSLSDAYTERAKLLADLVGPRRTIANFGNPGAGWVQSAVAKVRPLGIAAQHNSLKASTNPTAEHHRLVCDWPNARGFQFVGPAPGQANRFGGPFAKGLQLGRDCGGQWLETYRGNCAEAVRILNAAE